jgi:transcriptional regulator with XRE-family HTH domain
MLPKKCGLFFHIFKNNCHLPESQLDIEIGERLTELIGFVVDGTSRQLALRLNMDASQLKKIEKGIRGLTVEKAVEISTIYGISLNWLLRGVGDKFIEKEKPGPYQEPDLLTLVVKQEIEKMQLSLETLAKAASTTLGSLPMPNAPVQDLGLGKNRDRKSQSIKNELKDSVSKKGR